VSASAARLATRPAARGQGSGLLVPRPASYTPRRTAGLTAYERVLVRAGLGPVAGIDEAGRGACAGPLVVAAVALDRWPGDAEIADSKTLTARAREAAYRQIAVSALAWHVVVIEPEEIDRLGLHVCNVAGMRRALAGLAASPGYALTDGFEVPGLAVPALAMWKGDQVAACVAAASIVAKVTRDKIMCTLSAQYPDYGFARNKGYSTRGHMAALEEHGPCPVHRRSFVNVAARLDGAFRADGLADLDVGCDGPIVELTTVSSAAASSADRGEGTDECGDASGEASDELTALAPASSEGRT
jgi:ribonuclease HII